jgi:hypothetical protein
MAGAAHNPNMHKDVDDKMMDFRRTMQIPLFSPSRSRPFSLGRRYATV